MDLLVALLDKVAYLDFEDFISKSEILSPSQISFDCSGNCSSSSWIYQDNAAPGPTHQDIAAPGSTRTMQLLDPPTRT